MKSKHANIGWAMFVILALALAGCGADGKRDSSSGAGTQQAGAAKSGAQEPSGSGKAPTAAGTDNPADADLGMTAETKQGDFVYRLVAEPSTDAKTGSVKLYAELEYVGDKDKIMINHAESPFTFGLKELTRNYDIGYMMNQPLITRELKKGEPLREAYRGGGGYSEKDSKEYVAFLNDFWNHGFPQGQYIATGYAEFNALTEDGKEQPYKIEAKVAFTVKGSDDAGSARPEEAVAGDALYIPDGYQSELKAMGLTEVAALPYFHSPFLAVAKDSQGTQYAVIFREEGKADRVELPLAYEEIISLIDRKGFKILSPTGSLQNLHLFEINRKLYWNYEDGDGKIYLDLDGNEVDPFAK